MSLAHILHEMVHDSESREKIILNGCIPSIVKNTNDVHCGSIMTSLLFELSSNPHMAPILLENQLYRYLTFIFIFI